jgi:hypothetical protein
MDAPMEIDDFWALIDESRRGCADDPDEQAWSLAELLEARPPEEVAAFRRLYDQQLARAARWDLWGAGYVINGGMGDDSFGCFCHWLISRGRRVFERALADPDSLADVPEAVEDCIAAERLGEIAGAAAAPRDLDGEDWQEDDLPERFPRLWAKAAW